MKNQVHWTVWAIFGMVAVILLWNIFSTKQGNSIGFGVPKFGKKSMSSQAAAAAQNTAEGKTQTATK